MFEEKAGRIKDQSLRTQRQIQNVNRGIEVLSENINATVEQLQSFHVSFLLLKHKATEERAQCCPLLHEEEPQLSPGAETDQTKHLSNLTFNIWTNVKKLLPSSRGVPVIILVVALAVLSKDLSRFKAETGSEGFLSGSHSWEVDVGDNEMWGLGVWNCPFEERRRGQKEDGLVLRFFNGKYEAVKHGQYVIPLKLTSKPQRISVCLDCDKRKVSFYDGDAHIHTFTQIGADKLFPFAWTRRNGLMDVRESRSSSVCVQRKEHS